MEGKKKRIGWNKYFMDIAFLVAKRSTCKRRAVGAIIVKEKRILATGYNGAPNKMEHCIDIGCIREELNIPSGQRHELCRGIHAEQNAIIQAACYGVSIRGGEIFCTNQPCFICAKMIINAKIKAAYYKEDYADNEAASMLKKSGVKLIKV
ncbi:MAG: cytidine/deoxycytidylate deaminase family protein [Deltaproteobacteria bacterium]|nr:cytidine/deoxycytidylate deaminase family protein [Deltaproteobacteria bacterium]